MTSVATGDGGKSVSSEPGCFLKEIRNMMYVFGDCWHPNHESALLIEEITHQQICDLVVKTAEVTEMRGAQSMSVEDVLFLMRKDKNKQKRLIHCLSCRKAARKYTSSKGLDEEAEEEIAGEEDDQMVTSESKRKKISVDLSSDLEEEIDEIQLERLEQQDALTQGMGQARYMEYTECRRTHFNKNLSKFREWIDVGSLVEHRVGLSVVEVFACMAYETVRELVELSLLVRKDMESLSWDPLSAQQALQVGEWGNPSDTSYQTATKPFPGTGPGGSTTDMAPSLSSRVTLPSPVPSPSPPGSPAKPAATGRPLKRRRGRPLKQAPQNNAQTEVQVQPAVVSSPKSAVETSSGIRCVHIREALRRYNATIQPLAPFSTHFSTNSFTKRTLCL